MQVALYARVSSEAQEKRGTIASQVEALRHYAREHQYEIVENYVCQDNGYSGAMLARPELDRLRDGAQAGSFDAILVLAPDRLSRKYAYLILILEEFERFGTPVIFLEQGPHEDPHSMLLVQIQGAVAEYERAKLAERYRRGKLYRARHGEVFWATIPYGYRRVPRQGSVSAYLVINEVAAEVVRKIFSWHAFEEMSIRQIVKRLTREAYCPPKGGKHWAESTVHKILRQEAYLGSLHYNKSYQVTVTSAEGVIRNKKLFRPSSEWIPISIPPLIDRATFELSRANHEPNQQFSPRNLKEEHWLLRRLLRCERCGYKSACVADKRRPHMPPAYYYRCDKQGRVNEGPRCHPNHIRSGPLDELVWQEVRRHLLDPELLLKAQTTLMSTDSADDSFLITQLKNTRKRLAQTQGERRRLIDAFQGAFITKEEFEERTRNVSIRIENLQADLITVEEETKKVSAGRQLLTRISDFTKTLTEKLNDMTFHEKQTLLRTVIQEVVINGNTAKLFFKIPLPKKKVTDQSGNDSPDRKTVSSQFGLRSRAGHRRRALA
ncbi:recombinase family protein [soil metagenome]